MLLSLVPPRHPGPNGHAQRIQGKLMLAAVHGTTTMSMLSQAYNKQRHSWQGITCEQAVQSACSVYPPVAPCCYTEQHKADFSHCLELWPSLSACTTASRTTSGLRCAPRFARAGGGGGAKCSYGVTMHGPSNGVTASSSAPVCLPAPLPPAPTQV